LCGSINDDLTLVSSSIFVLGFAGLEFSIGILLIIFFKNLNKSISIELDNEELKPQMFLSKKKNYINRFYF
jgi:hypothetical protein